MIEPTTADPYNFSLYIEDCLKVQNEAIMEMEAKIIPVLEDELKGYNMLSLMRAFMYVSLNEFCNRMQPKNNEEREAIKVFFNVLTKGRHYQ